MNNNRLNYFVCQCEQTGRGERYIEDVIAAEVKIYTTLPSSLSTLFKSYITLKEYFSDLHVPTVGYTSFSVSTVTVTRDRKVSKVQPG